MKFTIKDADRTQETAQALFDVGRRNPRTDDWCTADPYVSLDHWVMAVNGLNPLIVAVDENDTIVGGISFFPDGSIAMMSNEYYLAADGSYTKDGNDLVAALFAGVKQRSRDGRAISLSANPKTVDITHTLGGHVHGVDRPANERTTPIVPMAAQHLPKRQTIVDGDVKITLTEPWRIDREGHVWVRVMATHRVTGALLDVGDGTFVFANANSDTPVERDLIGHVHRMTGVS